MANLMTSRLSGGGDGPERLSLRPPSCSPSSGKAVGHGVRLRSPHKTPTWFAMPRSGFEHDRGGMGRHTFVGTMLLKLSYRRHSFFQDRLGGKRHGKVP